MTESPIEPINDQIVVKVSEVKKKSDGGIILNPGDYFNRQEQQRNRGEIVAISKNAFKYIFDGTCDLKIGDTVLFGTYQGEEEVIETEEYTRRYRLIKDIDVRGVLKGDSKQDPLIPSSFVRETMKDVNDAFGYNK